MEAGDIHSKRDARVTRFFHPTPTNFDPVHHRTMPRIKQRSNIANLSLEQRCEKALEGLEDGTYESLAKAAQANDLNKSSLRH